MQLIEWGLSFPDSSSRRPHNRALERARPGLLVHPIFIFRCLILPSRIIQSLEHPQYLDRSAKTPTDAALSYRLFTLLSLDSAAVMRIFPYIELLHSSHCYCKGLVQVTWSAASPYITYNIEEPPTKPRSLTRPIPYIGSTQTSAEPKLSITGLSAPRDNKEGGCEYTI